MTAAPSTPTVLRATSSADLLAALPRLTGMSAPESCFVVMFDGTQTIGTARIDLPKHLAEHLDSPSPELQAWLRCVAELAAKSGGPVAIVVNTTARLTEQPVASPRSVLTAILAGLLQASGIPVLDALVVGSDGWASFTSVLADSANQPELRSLDEISASPLHDPEHRSLPIDQWREQHPDQTADGPEAIKVLSAQIRGGQR